MQRNAFVLCAAVALGEAGPLEAVGPLEAPRPFESERCVSVQIVELEGLRMLVVTPCASRAVPFGEPIEHSGSADVEGGTRE